MLISGHSSFLCSSADYSHSTYQCGVNTNGGWNPPNIQMDNVVYVDLATALTQSGTPFTACKPYLDIFNAAAKANGGSFLLSLLNATLHNQCMYCINLILS